MGVPWQVWVAVGFLAVEGLGNLISGFNILNQPMALVWLGAKTLLVTGLLLGWRLMFVLALIMAGHHVIQFAPVHPVAAVLNAVTTEPAGIRAQVKLARSSAGGGTPPEPNLM